MPLKRDKLRVALYTETFLPKLDGIVRILCLTLEHLRRIGAEAILFAPGPHVESYADYPVISIPGKRFPLYPELTLALPGRKYRDMLAEFNPDIVHVLNPVFTGTRGMHHARHLNKPVLASFHTNVMDGAEFYGFGLLKRPLWGLHRWIYNQSDYIVATSHHMVAELKAHKFKDVGLWRRGVHSGRFSPAFCSPEMRDRISGGNSDKTILLYVGRLAAEKRIGEIVHVLDTVPNTHLALVGDGPHRAKLEQIFAGRNVTFNGYMQGEELSAAYASADIFVFPASPFETFGLVVAEAMASGLAVTSGRVGGVPEIITHGESGYMFDWDDTRVMVELVRDLVEHPDKRASFGKQAREAVLPLTWDSIMDDFFETYEHVIDKYHEENPA